MAPRFDRAAAEEGYAPCARGQRCELQLVRPGKVQCDCDTPGTSAAVARATAETTEVPPAANTPDPTALWAQWCDDSALYGGLPDEQRGALRQVARWMRNPQVRGLVLGGVAAETTCVPTDTGHLCFATARSDLRYLIQEAAALEETADDERLANLHDVIEHAMETIRDQRVPDGDKTAGKDGDDEPPVVRFATDPRTKQRFRHLRSGGTLRVFPGDPGAIELDLYAEDGIAFSGDDEVRELAATLLAAIALPAAEAPRESLQVGDDAKDAADLDRLPIEAVIVATGGNVAKKAPDGWAWVNRHGMYPADGGWCPARVIDLPRDGQDTEGGAP